jgi:hypothetical protein
MTLTSYLFDLAVDFVQGVDVGQLWAQLSDLGFPSIEQVVINRNDNTITMMFPYILNESQLVILNTAVRTHRPSTTPDVVKVSIVTQNEGRTLAGMFHATTLNVLQVPPLSTRTAQRIFPVDATLTRSWAQASQDNIGDRFTLDMTHDATGVVGTLNDSVATASTNITVPASVMFHARVGLTIRVGAETKLGLIVLLDHTTCTITVEHATRGPLSPGDLIYLMHRYVDDYRLGYAGRHGFGDSNYQDAFIPKGTCATVTYVNTHPTAFHDFTMAVEVGL